MILFMSFKVFRPPKLLVMPSITQVKEKLSELVIHVKPVLDEHG